MKNLSGVMAVLFRQILLSFLILSLALTSPAPLSFAQSDSANTPPTQEELARIDAAFQEEFTKAQELDRQWGNLQELPKGQPKSSVPADRFLLMMQTVTPEEVPVVSRLGGHVLRIHKLTVLQQRVARFLYLNANQQTPERTFEDLPDSEFPSLDPNLSPDPNLVTDPKMKALVQEMTDKTLDWINNGRRGDTPYFLWIRRRNPEHLQLIQKITKHIESRWLENRARRMDNYTEATTVRRARKINWWDVSVVVQEGDRIVKTLPLADTSRYRSASGRQPFFCSSSACEFSIQYKKDTIHKFGIPSSMVATYGQFLIFTHQDSFDAETGTQYLSFIDLETYNTALGNEDLPVFRLPIRTEKPISSLRILEERLILNDNFWVDHKILQDASDLQQIAFNLTSNLVDPAEWEAMLPLIDSFRDHVQETVKFNVEDAASNYEGITRVKVLFKRLGQELQQQLDSAALSKPTAAADLNKKAAEDVAKWSPEHPSLQAVQLYHDRVTKSEALKERMVKITDRLSLSRKLKGRIDLLFSRMISPKPWASQKIKEALGIHLVKSQAIAMGPRSVLGNLMDRPFLNSGVLSAGIFAALMPESFQQLVNLGLSFGGGVFDYMMFSLSGMGESVMVGTDRTFAALYEPVKSLSAQYIDNGNWYRTLTFVPLFFSFIMSIYYIPHFLFNFHRYRQDIKSGKARNFIEQQSIVKREYYKKMADEDAKKHTGSSVTLTEEEKTEIAQWKKDREAGVHSRRSKMVGWFSRWFGKDKVTTEERAELVDLGVTAQFDAASSALKQADESTAIADVKDKTKEDFTTFWAAAKQMAFGYPSYEYTLSRWATFWNWYAGWRFCSVGFKGVRVCKTDIPLMISPKPVMWSSRILFPDLFNTVVAKRDGHLVIPSELNGGTRKRSAYDFVDIFSKSWAERLRMRFQGSTKEQLKTLANFEDKIIDVEKQVVEVAFREALAGLARFATSRKDLEVIFGADPLKSITGPQIKELSYASQTYLHAHFESIYNAGMQKFMEELVSNNASGPAFDTQEVVATIQEEKSPRQTPDDLEGEATLSSLKALKVEYLKQVAAGDGKVELNSGRAKEIALAVAKDSVHSSQARDAALKGRVSFKNLLMNTKFNVISNLDPEQNPSMARWAVVNKRLKSPSALGRAVRAEISKLLVTFPLDLTMKLFLTAGIMEGAMKPIQEQFWGPNATFYGSHMSFFMIMASGFAMGMMADAWMKVQMDQRQDDMGEFGQIPKGEDAVNGFFRWYKKQFFAPANSLWSNYLFNNKVIFWNLPAALFNISLFYYLFSGRVDLSLLVAGYAIAFGTPLYAMHTKVEQAFERAVHFAARGIKNERWLADPEIQAIIGKEGQKTRNRFTFWVDFFSGVEGNWTNAIETIPTSLGTRGFARALFGGKLIEEGLVENVFDPIRQAVANQPALGAAVNQVLDVCQKLLTHGNTDLNIKK